MILDCHGRPVKVEPIPLRPPENEWERNEREWLAKWLVASLKHPRVTLVP